MGMKLADAKPQKRVRRRVLLLSSLVVAACKSEPPLDVLGQIPNFAFTDQDGRSFGNANLRGHVSVAAFMFTRCPTICPRITTTMKGLQARAREDGVPIHWVSFSVDAENDTPPVLKRYAEQFQIDLDHWTFLTGDVAKIRETAEQGFKIAAEGSAEPNADHYGISHGSHLVLVDAAGQIRGYYRTLDDDAQIRLLRDAKRLTNGS
jgi:protein SCO1